MRALAVGVLLAGSMATAGGTPGAAAPAAPTYVLAPAEPSAGLVGQLIDTATGATTPVGNAQLASRDGRYVVLADGSWLDRQTNATFHPDLTPFVGPGTQTTLQLLAGELGTLYSLDIRVLGQTTFTSVVVDAAAHTVVGYPNRLVTGFSPNGRYIAFTDAIVDRTLGQNVAAGDPASIYYAAGLPVVDDDGTHVRLRGGRTTIETAGGNVVYEPVEFADEPHLTTGSSDDFRIGVTGFGVTSYASRRPPTTGLAYTIADHRTGKRATVDFPSADPTAFDRVFLTVTPDGDTLVLAVRECDASVTACHYGHVQLAHGLRGRLVPITYSIGHLGDGGTGQILIAGNGTVPFGARAVLLNVTVTNPTADGFVTVWPCDRERPLASNVNYRKGSTIAGAVIAPLGVDGATCVYSHAAADVVVDLLGTFTGSWLDDVPRRLLDTRDKNGTRVNGVVHLRVPGEVVALNITAVDPVADGFVTVWPCAAPRPVASNVNVSAGDTVANLVIVASSTDADGAGEVCLFASRPMHLVVDAEGSLQLESFDETPAAAYEPRTPLRLLDSRLRAGADGRVLPAGSVSEVAITHVDGHAAAAGETAVLNVTAVDPVADGFLTVYACDEPRPLASNLNHEARRNIANLVLAKVGAAGTVCVFNQQAADVVVDIAGIVPIGFDDLGRQAPFVGVTPRRLVDTRLGTTTSI